jgi:hypothetical protein
VTRRAAAGTALALLVATAPSGCGGRATETTIAPLEIGAGFDEPLPKSLGPGSPVRISGIEVGTVTAVERVPGGAVVHMTMRRGQASIHEDASIVVRPRIFLEGHFFVDLFPGTRSAPLLKSGARLPATQTTYKPTF